MYGMVRYEALPTIELSLLGLDLSFPFYECQSNEMQIDDPEEGYCGGYQSVD